MASKSSGEGSAQSSTGLNRMASGLIHTCDSQLGDEKGKFVSFFGEPGSPEGSMTTTNDAGRYPGNAPKLMTRFMRGGGK